MALFCNVAVEMVRILMLVEVNRVSTGYTLDMNKGEVDLCWWKIRSMKCAVATLDMIMCPTAVATGV